MTLAALFVAQATNTHLTLAQQFTLLGVAVLTSKARARARSRLHRARRHHDGDPNHTRCRNGLISASIVSSACAALP